MKTVVSKVNWNLWLYSWDEQYPGDGVSSNLISKSGLAIPISPGNPGKALERIKINKGVSYIAFSRNKQFHDNQLRISIVGRVHPKLIIGSWIVLQSDVDLIPVEKDDENEEDRIKTVKIPIPRFIGQVQDIDPTYEKDSATGQMRQVTVITVAEWSYVLNMAVRYDEAVIAGATASSNQGFTLELQNRKTLTAGQMTELMSKLLNPFEFVHLILSLIGALSDDQVLDNSSIKGLKLPPLALNMPAMPSTLLRDLGIVPSDTLSALPGFSNVKSKVLGDRSDDPLAAGIFSIITGVLKKGFYNDGKWNGFLNNGEIEKMARGDGSIYNKKPSMRPSTAGLTPILSQGLSAWQMIQSTCDPDFNEFFSDILYEINDSYTQITAKPVLWMRDKPFALRSSISSNSKLSIAEWTVYDDLPRLYISDIYIERVAFKMSKNRAYNYIRLEFTQALVSGDLTRALSILRGTSRRRDEMSRFGGQELFAQTNYVSQDIFKNSKSDSLDAATSAIGVGKGSNPMWFEQLKLILDAWWGEYYKTPSATMVIKDNNLPLAVGINLTWQMGDMILVGHVVGFSTTIHVDETGRHTSETIINLDRIVKTIKDPEDNFAKNPPRSISKNINSLVDSPSSLPGANNDLEIIPPEKLTNIFRDIDQSTDLSRSFDSILPNVGSRDKELDKINTDPLITA